MRINNTFNDPNDYIDYLTVEKVKYDVTRRGYNPHKKDAKKKTLARKRAINAKLARRPQ